MRFGLICMALLVAAAQASEAGKHVKYQPPEGFAGHEWGDLRSSFDRLPEEPRGVAAAWMRTQQKQTGFHCVPNTSIPTQTAGAQDFCNFQETLLRLRSEFNGGGVYVLSEYAIESTTDIGALQQIATSAQPARRPYRLVPSRCRATAAPTEASQLTAIAALPGSRASADSPRISIG